MQRRAQERSAESVSKCVSLQTSLTRLESINQQLTRERDHAKKELANAIDSNKQALGHEVAMRMKDVSRIAKKADFGQSLVTSSVLFFLERPHTAAFVVLGD
jgi:seryl-tRNA synthetase